MIKFFGLRMKFLEKCMVDEGVSVDSFVFGKQHRHSRRRTQQFLTKILDIKPDIFWIMKDPFINPGILRRIKRNSPKTKICMWWGDQRGGVIPPLINQRKGLLDVLFVTNGDPAQRKMYNNFGIKNVFTFYHSFSTDEFKLWGIKPKFDVFFGGSCFKLHKFPLSGLRKQFIDGVNNRFKLVVHGGGWDFPTGRWLLRPDYAKALRTAKINLGINHYHITQYYNRRLFESVASGRLHITYYVPKMEKHFKNRSHLVWFTNIEQGLDQIRYFLNHPAERERIAENGRNFFIRNHSWPIRAKQLKVLLEKIL